MLMKKLDSQIQQIKIMKNPLLENVEYKIETTNLGSWRRYSMRHG